MNPKINRSQPYQSFFGQLLYTLFSNLLKNLKKKKVIEGNGERNVTDVTTFLRVIRRGRDSSALGLLLLPFFLFT